MAGEMARRRHAAAWRANTHHRRQRARWRRARRAASGALGKSCGGGGGTRAVKMRAWRRRRGSAAPHDAVLVRARHSLRRGAPHAGRRRRRRHRHCPVTPEERASCGLISVRHTTGESETQACSLLLPLCVVAAHVDEESAVAVANDARVLVQVHAPQPAHRRAPLVPGQQPPDRAHRRVVAN